MYKLYHLTSIYMKVIDVSIEGKCVMCKLHHSTELLIKLLALLKLVKDSLLWTLHYHQLLLPRHNFCSKQTYNINLEKSEELAQTNGRLSWICC